MQAAAAMTVGRRVSVAMPIDRPDGEQAARRYGHSTPPVLAIVGSPWKHGSQCRFRQAAAIIVRRPDVRYGAFATRRLQPIRIPCPHSPENRPDFNAKHG